jgi:hypothetical protein
MPERQYRIETVISSAAVLQAEREISAYRLQSIQNERKFEELYFVAAAGLINSRSRRDKLAAIER